MKNLHPNVTVDEIIPFKNEEYEGLCFKWYGNIGFGEYNIYRKTSENQWHGDSECMDTNDDKSFLKILMEQFIERIDIDK